MLALLIVFVSPVYAVMSCHCFQDRVYDPARPDAADAYFLATVQNSLIAAALDIPKKSIVKAKMGGADADLLWVSYYMSHRTGLSFSDALAAYAGSADGWSEFVKKVLQSTDKLDMPFVKVLARPSDMEGLADGAYRSVMSAQLGFDEADLDRLEISGAGRKEQILAAFISLLTADDPVQIIESVKAGKQTWSQALATTGLDPKQIEPSWQKLLKLHSLGL